MAYFIDYPPFIAGLILTYIAFVIGSWTDFKWHEMPDWINYGLIFSGIGIHAIYSAIIMSIWPLIYSLSGLLAMYIISALMYYTGQWGGGDSKALMGMGALLGMHFDRFPFLISFIMNALIIGAFYGLFWSIALAIFKWKRFKEHFREEWNNIRKIRRTINIFAVLFAISTFFINNLYAKLMMLFFAGFGIVFYLLISFVKAIEKGCMYKHLTPEQLVEGDWITDEIIIKKDISPYDVIKEKYEAMLRREKDEDLLLKFYELLKEFGIRKPYERRIKKYSIENFRKDMIKNISKEYGEDVTEMLKKKSSKDEKLKNILEKYNIYFGKVYVTGPKELGIEVEQIELLKKMKIKKVEVKEGIPFIPSFLISLIITVLYGNLFFLLRMVL